MAGSERRADSRRQSFHLDSQIAKGAVVRVQSLDTSDLCLEGGEMASEVICICASDSAEYIQ